MATLLQTVDEFKFENFYIFKNNSMLWVYIYDYFSGCGNILFVALMCVSQI